MTNIIFNELPCSIISSCFRWLPGEFSRRCESLYNCAASDATVRVTSSLLLRSNLITLVEEERHL